MTKNGLAMTFFVCANTLAIHDFREHPIVCGVMLVTEALFIRDIVKEKTDDD